MRDNIVGKISSEGLVPIYSWIPEDEIEAGAKDQLRDAVTHPNVIEHIAVFPDIHQGYGIPVGVAFKTEGVVVPNAVGVDIGCGVSAVRTGWVPDEDLMYSNFWENWASRVRARIPTGFAWHDTKQRWDGFGDQIYAPLDKDVRTRAMQQIGTLGGGNHFLEAGMDDAGEVWLLVHSGSRGIGNKIAQWYHAQATDLRRLTDSKEAEGLASLPIYKSIGEMYLSDMGWAMEYAAESRSIMLNTMLSELELAAGNLAIDTPHNAAWIVGNNDEVLHRKGATLAPEGGLAVIPGSMGAPSFIVQGKGHPLAHESCSHGAGRRMSRGEAKRQISIVDLERQLSGTLTAPSLGMLDEAPGAYKDIELGIERQSDLIDVVHKIHPIITIKGDAKARDD